MKVQDIMRSSIRIAQYEPGVSAVARLIREEGCGVLPVTDIDLRLLQAIANRELAFAAGNGSQPAASIMVGELILGKFLACRANDDIETALAVMVGARLQRLPVISHGAVRGMISISDIEKCADII